MSKSKEERFLDKATDRIMREKIGEKREKKIDDFGKIVQEYGNFYFPKKGDITEAKVVQTNKEGILMDIGAKSEGFMPWEELTAKREQPPQPGKSMQVYISEKSEKGQLLLSEREADFRLSWAKFEEAFKQNESIVVKVKKIVKGGLLASLNSLNAFIPASHISLNKGDNLKEFIGRDISVRVIKLEKNLKNIVLSRKLFLLEEKEKRKEKTLASLEEGKIVAGRVSSITKFGIFVNLGGIDGLIYPENLSWEWVKNPQDLLSRGDEIKVKVLKLDKERGKISLGLKQTKPDPWKKLLQKYKVGDIVSGKVQQITNFGVFVNLASGIDGLIHISELDKEYVPHPEKVTSIGKDVKAEIVEIDEKKRRIRLSVRRLIKTKKETKKKEKEEKINSLPSFEEDGIVIGDFIEEKMKEKLKKGF
ncbi:S1 RNA-binding domain-containing protein [Candidatus Aerophobetes bacterium]|uniref:S1 RNA-binding domain-containing protein n=1 Tax=Aerophobetes bacterium TaxID=2030807 RepID=A0A523RUK1_UNCAE|nr:MAG: S1 RNA-binding domain-containing protein [Candidatus Aerophobetes bacterium]